MADLGERRLDERKTLILKRRTRRALKIDLLDVMEYLDEIYDRERKILRRLEKIMIQMGIAIDD
jgi:hypothetical protein